MGTRSRTEVLDGNACIVSIYRHMDGYPTGQGADILKLVKGAKIGQGAGDHRSFNGLGDFAAQLVWHLKKDEKDPTKPQSGNVYINTPMTEDGECGEEYVYRISERNGKLFIQVTGGDMTAFGRPNDPAPFKGLFYGDVDAFDAWITAQVQADEAKRAAI